MPASPPTIVQLFEVAQGIANARDVMSVESSSLLGVQHLYIGALWSAVQANVRELFGLWAVFSASTWLFRTPTLVWLSCCLYCLDVLLSCALWWLCLPLRVEKLPSHPLAVNFHHPIAPVRAL